MTDKKTQTEIRKELLQARHRAEEAQGTEPCERAKCPDTQADSGGCRLESIFPEFRQGSRRRSDRNC